MSRPEIKTHRALWQEIEGLPIIGVFLVLIGVFMVTAPESFLGYRIYMTFLGTVTPPLILGLGLTLVITAGEIDLSFPSVMKMSGLTFAYLVKFEIFPLDAGLADKHDLLPYLALLAALIVGAAIGFINGVLIARVGIPSIIATLATLFVWEGATVILSGGLSHNIRQIGGYSIYDVLTGRIGPVPVQALWALGLAVVTWFVLNRRRFGEHLLFIGDNPEVARVLGVDVVREKIKLFTLMGVLGALAGVVLTLDNKNFFTTQGSGYLLIVMAAVFIGGTSITGGKGSIVGTFFASFIVGSIEAGIVASGLGGFWTRLVVGLVFLTAVIVHIFMENPRKFEVFRQLVGFRFGHGPPTGPPGGAVGGAGPPPPT
ncbi:MAG: ABC transporter permease [Proteobacteria bacterium]|nr:ABC transporter permease [Pseudomonadota bacterium]